MYYLSHICSLCLVNNENMKSILSKDSDNIVIEEKLKTFFLELIHFKPYIPKYICDNCLKNLNFCHKFKLSCIENIATLNTYVEKLEVHGPYTNLSITLLTHRKCNKEEALELENQNYSNSCKNQIQTNCPQDNNVVQNEFIKEDIEETEIVYDENIIIMAETRQINSSDIKAEIKEDLKISFEDTVLEEKLTNVVNNKQFNEEKHMIEESENLTSNNMGEMKCEIFEEITIKEENYDEAEANDWDEFPNEISNAEELLNKTSEHIVNPLVNTNLEDEYCVSDPEPFEDNASDDKYLPSHSSSSAASEAADSDFDTVETPASHKVIKSEGTNSNETEELLNKTSEHIVNPLVNTNLEDEDCVSDPEPFENNASDDKYLPSHSSSSAASEVADSDFDTVETPASHKVIKSEGTNSNETAMFCNKTFTYNHTISMHKRIHNNIRPHKCSVCFKAFAHSRDLTKHERIHTGEKPYKCNVCNKAFAQSGTLFAHERIHSGEKPYKCNVCNLAFAKSSTLVTHERIHSGKKPYKCNVCNKTFAHSSALTIHDRIHTGKKPYKCNVCNTAFVRRDYLTAHERIHSGKKPYKCDVCNKVFADRSNRTRHERIHTGKKSYKCNVCDKTFAQSSDLTKHEWMHIGKKPYKCNVCNAAFVQRGDLTSHERIHSGEKPYKCNVCNKVFAHRSNLTRHERIHTVKKSYKCNVCDKTFAQSSNLTTHERMHIGKKPYKCKVCNKTFARNGDLTKHERIHTGEKPYKCKVCNKAFVASSNLVTHERIHSGKKPYKCNVCNKVFAQSSSLVTHERIHSGKKPYNCNVCNKSFAQCSDLTKHERIHTGEKPYKCNVCNKAFVQRGTLTIHEQIHTGKKPYKCNVCNKAFRQNRSLKKHEQIHNNVDQTQ